MELFRLLGTVVVDNGEALKSLDDTTGKAEQSESKISGAFKKIGAAVATYFAAEKIIGFGKACVDMYADYEQLVGGVETLFDNTKEKEMFSGVLEDLGYTTEEIQKKLETWDDPIQTVMNNADAAFKTAGLSANEYMETVTGFSASLIQSLGGDTAQAAHYADTAIVDMADNANKMGSSIENIQNAYSGFAKQNYTMLDNLKLGYGGTKEEMKRLLADATALSGIEYDISSFADIVDAIHVIQGEMGISGRTAEEAAEIYENTGRVVSEQLGTTAKEANATISGSLASMKAAWANLMTGFGNEEADLSGLTSSLTETVVIYGKNLLPRIGVIVTSIGEVVVKEVPKAIAKIPSAMGEILPEVASKVVNGFKDAFGSSPLTGFFSEGFIQDISGILDNLGAATSRLGGSLFSTFSGKMGAVKESIGSWISVLKPLVETWILNFSRKIEGLVLTIENFVLPAFSLFADVIFGIATTVYQAVQPAIEKIAGTFSDFGNLLFGIYTEWILPTLSEFINMIQELWLENQDKVTMIGELFSTVFNLIATVIDWFYVNVIQGVLAPAIAFIFSCVSENMGNVKAVFQSVFDFIGGIVQFFTALFKGDWQGMWEAVKSIATAGKDFIVNRFNLIKSFLVSIGTPIKNAVTKAFEYVRSAIEKKLNQAGEIVTKKFENIVSTINKKMENAKKTVSNAVQKLKDLFNFEWKLPEIKLPQFKVEGGFSIDPPSVPKFDVEWYAKGAVLNRPTAFGINGNRLMVGGEAGAEAIAPIDVLMEYVRAAVAEQNNGLYSLMERLVALIETYMPELLVASKKQIVLNNGALVGELAPAIDKELGGYATWKDRGNR